MSRAPVPDLILERYRLGELPAGTMDALRARLAAEPDLRARLEALDRSDVAILEAHPPARVSRLLENRRRPVVTRPAPARRPRPARPWYLRPALSAPAGVALACGLLLLARPVPGPGNAEVTEDAAAYSVRLKGAEAGLAIYRKVPGGTELLPPQSIARPGDTLQVFYHSRHVAYGMIFSVDGSGSVTLHLPEDGDQAAALQAGDLSPLPHAYRLDRAPRLERFFLVTSPAPFAVESMLARARASFAVHHAVPDSLEGLQDGFQQYRYTLLKPDSKKGGSR